MPPVLVFGHRSFPLAPAAFLRSFASSLDRLPWSPPHDDLVSLLVDFGEAEAAVADALQPDADDEQPALAAWRAALCAVAAAVCGSWLGNRAGVRRAIADARARTAALERTLHPAVVEARVAEGFAQYALYPEQYIAAAERFATALQPTRVVCVGLRSIGSTLAAVVASALKDRGVAATMRSLRPRGDPWDRRVAITPALASSLAHSGASHFAIVDEGPGISGSSFAAAADALVALGIATDRIVVLPAWIAPVAALRSVRAQAAMTRHRQFVGTFEETSLPRLELDGRALDVSAGRWRSHVLDPSVESWPPVQPQHERRKYLRIGGTADLQACFGPDPQADAQVAGSITLLKFAGLGRHGGAKLARAAALAGAGFTPRPVGIRSGFLEREWIRGQPLSQLSGAATAIRIAEYIAFVGRRFATGARARVNDLVDMIRHNLADDAGRPEHGDDRVDVGAIEGCLRSADAFDSAEVAVDGRMLPYEWIQIGTDVRKVDALDHHADDFLPGCRDVAWDVAGALVEGDFDEAARGVLVQRYAAISADGDIYRRLPFYITAYAAYRLGYVTLAADVLGDTPDGRAFRRAASRYRRSLGAPAPRRG